MEVNKYCCTSKEHEMRRTVYLLVNFCAFIPKTIRNLYVRIKGKKFCWCLSGISTPNVVSAPLGTLLCSSLHVVNR